MNIEKNKSKIYTVHTIIDKPPKAEITALKPSETFCVTDDPTTVVSAARRFINSPLLVRSKKAISCLTMEPKMRVRSLCIIR